MQAQAPSSETAQRHSAGGSDAAGFVDRFESAWAKSDANALVSLLDDEVVLVQPMMPPTAGKAAARKEFSRLLRLIPDLHATVHRWAARDELLFIEFTLSGSFGGREVSWPAVDRFLLRDGLAVERISYFDSAPLVAQMLTRPRGWRRLVSSGFRPSFRTSERRPAT